MDYTTLGRTGLKVSVAGLGCGGNSRIGLGTGATPEQSIAILRAAYDRGINFFDTAEVYGTEDLVGKAFTPSERGSIVISTKSRIMRGSEPMSPAEVVANLDASLRKLRTDHVDVYLLHGIGPATYAHARDVIAPVLLKEQEKGKLRHFGLSETSPGDPEQRMLHAAVSDPTWSVVMLAYHMLNQNARKTVLPLTMRHGVGTLMMFVVRNIFSKPGLLAETVARLVAEGRLPAAMANEQEPLGFLVKDGGARSIIDAAYRFVRHEPGCNVVLFGTSSIAHLESNISSILSPPLPRADVERLYHVFGGLIGVGLDLPDHIKPGTPGARPAGG